MDQLKILEILNENKGKDFVNRILNAVSFPTLPNRDGSESTHGMMFSEVDGKYIVYPSVVYDEEVMARLGPDTALGRALRTEDFVEFDTIQDAYEFSKEYKKLLPLLDSDKEKPDKIYPKRKTIWKDMNTGPGTLSGDSMSEASDGN